MNNVLLVFAGGGLGSLARYSVALLVKKFSPVDFPVATLISNILSCLILAIAFGFFSQKLIAMPTLHLLIITGFCGGFSTFSAFSFETIELVRLGQTLMAVINIAVSLITCFAIVFFIGKNT
jgi:CrcB protein